MASVPDNRPLHAQRCSVPFQVLDAMRGLRTIYMGKGAKMVPLKEMVDAITVNKQAQAPIDRGQWVRLRGGLYKDDLAKVREGGLDRARAGLTGEA